MVIEKNGAFYTVMKTKTMWDIKKDYGALKSDFNVSKADCPTEESLRACFGGGVPFAITG